MIKKLFAIGMLALTCLGASAQDKIFDNPNNPAYFGFRLGVDVVCPGDVKYDDLKHSAFKTGAGFNTGFILNMPIWKNMYIEPGVKVYYNSMPTKAGYTSDIIPASAKVSYRRSGFRIPIRVGYHFDFDPVAIHVFTGFEPDCAWWGRQHATANIDGNKWSSNEKLFVKDGLRRFDLGWQFGAAVAYHNWWFEVCGNVGMLDLQPGPASYHQNYCAFTLGYNFIAY